MGDDGEKLGAAWIPIRAKLDELEKDLDQLQGKVNKPLEKIQGKIAGSLGKIAKTAVLGGLTAVVAGVAAIGTAAFASGMQFDEAFDSMVMKTGATGERFAALKEDAQAVFKDIPTDINAAADVVGTLNQRLGVTGETAQELAKRLLMMGTGDAAKSTELYTRVMGDWGIASEDASSTLDTLFKTSQLTGVGVDDLMAKVVQFGAPLRLMGFSIEESAAMFGKWEKEGVNAELVMGSLRIAAGKFAKAGVPLQQGLQDTIAKIAGTTDASEALALGMEVFGARAGPDMVAAIREGRFSIEDLTAAMGDSKNAILDTAYATMDFPEKLKTLKNKVQTALAPVGGVIMDTLGGLADKAGPMIEKLIPIIEERILPLVQKIGDALGQVMSGDFSGGLSTLFGPETAGKITGIATGIGEAIAQIGEFKDKLVTAVTTLFGQIGQGDFSGAANTIGTLLRDTIGMGVDWVRDNLGPLVERINQSIRGMLSTAANNLATGDNPLGRILGTVIQSALSAGAGGTTGGGDVGAGAATAATLADRIKATLITAFNGLVAAIPELAAILKSTIATALNNAFSGGAGANDVGAGAAGASTLGEKIKSVVTQGVDWFKTNAGPTSESMGAGLTSMLAKAQDAFIANGPSMGPGIGQAIGTVIRLGIAVLVGTIAAYGTLMFNFLKGMITKSTETGGQTEMQGALLKFFGGILEGLMTGLTGDPQWAQKLGAFFVGLWAGVTDWANEIATKVEAVGEAIINGLIKGVEAKAGELIAAAKKPVTDAIGGVKSFLGISSPSTVMAEVGQDIMAGVTGGVESNTSQLSDALDQVVTRFIRLADSISPEQGKTFEKVADGIKDLALAMKGFSEVAATTQSGGGVDIGAYMDWFETMIVTVMSKVQDIINRIGRPDKEIKDLTKAASRMRQTLDAVLVDLSTVQPSDLSNFDLVFEQLRQLFLGALLFVREMRNKYGQGQLSDLAKVTAPITALVQMAMLDATKVPVSEDAAFAATVDRHFAQVEAIVNRAMEWLNNLTVLMRDALRQAAEIAPDIQALGGLVGAIDPSQIVPSESATFEADVDAYFSQQEIVGSRAMSWLMRISEVWRAALAAAAPVVDSIKAVLGLAGATDVTAIAVSESSTFEADVDRHFAQQEYIGSQAVGWISRISEVWRAALAAMQPTIEHVKNVLSLGGAADMEKLVPSPSRTFEADVDARFAQLEYVGGVIVGWLSRISEPWRVALAALGPVAKNIQEVFAVTQIGTDVAAVDRGTFVSRVISHLSAMIEATPLVKTALETIKSQWSSLEAMAADAGLSDTIKKFFSILDLSKTFEELQVIKPIQRGERRTALSNVIANFITQLKAGAPMLRTGLAEVEALFDGTLDSSIAIAEKIASVFEAIAKAIKAGIEATTQEGWDLSALLNIIAQLGTAMQAVGNIQMPSMALPTLPSLGEGVMAQPSLGGMPGTAGEAHLESMGAGGAGIAESVRSAIVEGLQGSELAVTLTLEQDREERRRFSLRLGRIERMMATMVTQMEASGG